ncbi:MAG: SNARE associated Golgi protein [Syntrophus sp. PtaB.Bin001]|nr:MAG: SNARE associated Golgi protein [Syntrophus sp. PtaB.Bin001]
MTELKRNIFQNNRHCDNIIPLSKNRTDADSKRLIEKPGSTSFPPLQKEVLFILVLFFVILALHLSPLGQYRESILTFCERISGYGTLAPFLFTVSVAVLVTIGIPRLLLCTIGGMLFGLFQGLLYSVAGTIIACFIVFSLVRGVGRNYIVTRYPKLDRFAKLVERGGIPAVILARQIPIHGMVINLMLGLSPVKRRDFLIGTAIGLLPQAIPFTLIGKGVKQESIETSFAYIVAAVVILAVLWFWLKMWTEKKKACRN